MPRLSSETSLVVLLLIVVGIGTAVTFYTQRPKPVIHRYDNTALSELSCLSLRIDPPDKRVETRLRKLYTFDAACPYRLTLRYKKSIVCNSSYNADKKCLGGMPHAFIRFEVARGFRTLLEWYLDIDGDVDADRVEEAFKEVMEALKIKRTSY
jgi:hypothetical protein